MKNSWLCNWLVSAGRRLVVMTGIIAMNALLMMGCGEKNPRENSEIDTEWLANTQESDSEKTGITLPYELEDGKIVVNSVFPSDIENPDCSKEYKDGVGTIEFVNDSEEYLREVSLTVTMEDGSVRYFNSTDIPSRATCWSFEKVNQTVEMQQTVQSISCETTFGEYENSVMDLLDVDCEVTTISITNNSDQKLENLQVICHDDMGEAYFGGTSYIYSVDHIGTGETTVVNATECILGVSVIDIIKE